MDGAAGDPGVRGYCLRNRVVAADGVAVVPDRNRRVTAQERCATSCLVAVMRGVSGFGRALLKELAAPKSPLVETLAQVRFQSWRGAARGGAPPARDLKGVNGWLWTVAGPRTGGSPALLVCELELKRDGRALVVDLQTPLEYWDRGGGMPAEP